MDYQLMDTGNSRSFPNPHPLLSQATECPSTSEAGLVIIGEAAGTGFHSVENAARFGAVLVELGTECLGVHTGESRGTEGSNVLGFNRFRLGNGDPSDLVELVRQPRTSREAVDAARGIFESAGLEVAVCLDFAGRILDRLIRPYYNEALRRLDEGLASADDLDLTLRLGLGYPEGPIGLLERTGLAEHHDVSAALFEVYGERAYAPARRAKVAKQRAMRENN